ncbi:MAG: nicotinate-nucleotide--dimethylbenzimidazole phosphoribosyltransferase [Gammaproteobacteria bacterium]
MNGERDWIAVPAAFPDEAAGREAQNRQAQLTKPPGSLGRLEALAIRLAALQGTREPHVDRVRIAVFAADHGVAAEHVSAFPQSVTAEMVRNLARGGAAINVLARAISATLEVINLGTVSDTGPLEGVIDCRLGPGTENLSGGPAMSSEQCARALQAGRHAAERACVGGAQLFIGGEMGIGNTTAAAAMACALLHLPPEDLAGPGTGLDPAGVARKTEVIRRALVLHRAYVADSHEVLRRLGGFEIAALAGSYLACAQRGLPVLVDGFIASVAALTAACLCPDAPVWFFFAHASAEPGHRRVLAALDGQQPLLDLGMRLGEGSGAAVAVLLLRLACALHNEMATFADAGVSGKVR